MTSALALRDDQDFWDDRQLAALRQLGVSEASNADLAVFLHQAQRTGLDPFARQIYMIGRWDSRADANKWTIQASIDGLRLVARRAADAHRESLGYEDTMFCGADRVWTDVWLDDEPPAAAKVVVLRAGNRFPAVARFSSYAQTTRKGDLTAIWARMPDVMLSKCAEALALRKAFPQDLSGIYTDDEMAQATPPASPPVVAHREATAAPPVTVDATTGEIVDAEPVAKDPAHTARVAVLRDALTALGRLTGTEPTWTVLGEDYTARFGAGVADASVEELADYAALLGAEADEKTGVYEPVGAES